MEVLGWVFLVIIAAIVVTAVAVGFISIPDARRYLKMRRM